MAESPSKALSSRRGAGASDSLFAREPAGRETLALRFTACCSAAGARRARFIRVRAPMKGRAAARAHVRPPAGKGGLSRTCARARAPPSARAPGREEEGRQEEERRHGGPSVSARRVDAPPRAAELHARQGGGGDRIQRPGRAASRPRRGDREVPPPMEAVAASGRSPRARAPGRRRKEECKVRRQAGGPARLRDSTPRAAELRARQGEGGDRIQ